MAKKIMIDGNTAAATVAYSVSEICAITLSHPHQIWAK